MADKKTIQSNIKSSEYSNSIKDYALFMGGTNVTHDVLSQYDPLKTGYNRLFMVRKPVWVAKYIPSKFDKFKHILEYGNVSISGLGDITVNTNQITGGYVGKSFEIPSYAEDGTNSFSVQVYEFSGSPIREVLHTWINGSTDLLTGLTTYNGEIDNGIPINQANQTAEFIYVATDCSGREVEYACMFANCFPKGISLDPFNYNSGEHNLVETTIEFSCTKYESIQINQIAKALLDKYKLLANSLNFYSGISVDEIKGGENKELGLREGFGYNVSNGKLDTNLSNTETNNLEPTSYFDNGSMK